MGNQSFGPLWPLHNKPLVPTRPGEAPLLAAAAALAP